MVSLTTFAIIAAILNFKNLPGVFHVRFYYYVIKNSFLYRKCKPRDVFSPTVMTTFTTFFEMDLNWHKSNSTYFTDMDISRTDLLSSVSRRFYTEYNDPDLPPLKRYQWVYTPLGSTSMVFRKEIKPYMPYEVKSQIIGWTRKWLFVLSIFQSKGEKKTIYAYGVSKYVLKQQRKTISPEIAIEHSGLSTPAVLERNKRFQKIMQDSLALEEIINIVD